MLKYSKRQRTEIAIPEIQQIFVWDSTKLCYLYIQIDKAILEGYGLQVLNLHHNFYEVEYLREYYCVRYTINPDARREVLKRLLDLNQKIHAQEDAD
jgi:hypothetical protein